MNGKLNLQWNYLDNTRKKKALNFPWTYDMFFLETNLKMVLVGVLKKSSVQCDFLSSGQSMNELNHEKLLNAFWKGAVCCPLLCRHKFRSSCIPRKVYYGLSQVVFKSYDIFRIFILPFKPMTYPIGILVIRGQNLSMHSKRIVHMWSQWIA